MSIFTFLTLILIVLKLFNLIAWSWVAVFAPPIAAIVVEMFLVIIFFKIFERK